MPDSTKLIQAEIEKLKLIGQRCWQRGWTRSGSCNYSSLVEHSPIRLLITNNHQCRSQLADDDFSVIDILTESTAAFSEIATSDPASQPSIVDRAIHLWIVANRSFESKSLTVIQTQSVWSALLADRFATLDGVLLEKHPLLSQLTQTAPLNAHWLPIVPGDSHDNQPDQQIAHIESALSFTPSECQPPRAIIVQNNSLFTWAPDPNLAFRQAEIFEYFCEYLVRRASIA